MKHFLLGVIMLGSMASTQGQTNLTEAVDFTVTLTSGEQFNLFDKLAEGKYVCIDWFFTTCGPCQANQPFYTEAFQNFGCNQGEVFFVSIETTVGDAEPLVYEETFAGENHPPAASGIEGGGIDAVSLYGIGAFPTFILIAPNGAVVEQDMWPLSNGAATFTTYFEAHGIGLMSCATDVSEQLENMLVSTYPSPTNNQVFVEFSGLEGSANSDIYDILRPVVYPARSASGFNSNVVPDWPVGSYWEVVSSGNRVTTTRCIVGNLTPLSHASYH